MRIGEPRHFRPAPQQEKGKTAEHVVAGALLAPQKRWIDRLAEGALRSREEAAYSLNELLVKRATEPLDAAKQAMVAAELSSLSTPEKWEQLSTEAQQVLDMLGVFGVPASVVAESGDKEGTIPPVLLTAFEGENSTQENKAAVTALTQTQPAARLTLRYPAMHERPGMTADSKLERQEDDFPEMNPYTFVAEQLRDASGDYDLGFLNEVVGLRADVAENGGLHDKSELESFVEWILKLDDSLTYDKIAGVFEKEDAE